MSTALPLRLAAGLAAAVLTGPAAVLHHGAASRFAGIVRSRERSGRNPAGAKFIRRCYRNCFGHKTSYEKALAWYSAQR